MNTYENKWPGINFYFSFNTENFMKTYNVPGMILGGEDPIVIETQSLLSRRKEQQRWPRSQGALQAMPFIVLSETSLRPGVFIFRHNFLNEWRAPDR